ncbi:hypothetical protein ACS0TY_035258 [Phlomoides rotata]
MEKAICHSVIILIGQEIGTVYRHQVTRALRDTVDDGYHLQIPFLHTLRQTTGVLAGMYEVLPKHLATKQVSVLMQVILITHVEPAYSFVGMHFIFDQCKAMVTVIKFGHMSSDLLAYGASDGSLTVCTVSTPPSVLKQFTGHTKDVTEKTYSRDQIDEMRVE